MFSNEEILKMLREGTSPDDIAKAMSDALNSANKTFEAEKSLAAEKRENAISDLEDLLLDWYTTYADEFADAEELILDLLKNAGSVSQKLSDFYCKYNKKVSDKPKKNSYEDVMNDFLKEFGLL